MTDQPAAHEPAPICFLDTETIDLHPDRRLPWEIAIIRRSPNGVETTWSAFVEVDLADSNRFALNVGRFYERHPLGLWLAGQMANYPYPRETDASKYVTRAAAAREVARRTHDAHLVGMVPDFDAWALDPLLREHQLAPAWHYHLADVENLAVGYLAATGAPLSPPWSSTQLGELLGVRPASDQERHTALGDALWAQRFYDRIMAGPDSAVAPAEGGVLETAP